MALKRELGFLEVFSIASGTMISSGLFVLPGILFAHAGPSVFVAYLVATVLLIPAVLTKAELVTAMPKSGGVYFFVDRSLGPGFGMVAGIAAWASLSLKSAFALIGIGALATLLWPQAISAYHVKAIASAFCLLFMAINLFGVKGAGRLQVVLVAVLLAILLAYALAGLGSVKAANYSPMLPRGWMPLLGAVAMVFISFGGVTKAAALGEEVKQPHKNIVAGMFAAYIVVGIVYVLLVFVTVGILPAQTLSHSLTALSHGAGALWGWAGAVILSVAGLCAFLTTGNAGILTASRTIMAMSRDGHLPRFLQSVSKRRGTPASAIIFTTAFMVAIIMSLDLVLLVKAASAMMIFLFIFSMVSMILMRESRIPTYQPTWRCPFYPWPQVVGIAVYSFLLIELGTVPLFIASAILGGALVWYYLFGKVHALRESALTHLASRVAAADFPDHDLEAELSKIARERDEIVADRFDLLIHECPVLDLEEPISREHFFRLTAETLSGRLGLPAEEICALLESRERISSTVIRPGFALPHSISERVDSFQLLLARSRGGISFKESDEPVHVVFVVLGPPDERNFYLQSLMAIAEIAQDEHFDRKWSRAGSTEALRELILSAERRRNHASAP